MGCLEALLEATLDLRGFFVAGWAVLVGRFLAARPDLFAVGQPFFLADGFFAWAGYFFESAAGTGFLCPFFSRVRVRLVFAVAMVALLSF
jgi:hypothetical protein